MSMRPHNPFLGAVLSKVLSWLVIIFGATNLPLHATAEISPENQVRDGTFLILDTCKREQELHFLPIVKTTPNDISDYLKRISTAADETIATIDRLQKKDASLVTNKNPLPLIEQKAQKLFIGAAQKKVLFGSKGSNYLRALLVDQIQESVYIGSVAKVSADEDADTDRAKTLGRIASRWLYLREKVIDF